MFSSESRINFALVSDGWVLVQKQWVPNTNQGGYHFPYSSTHEENEHRQRVYVCMCGREGFFISSSLSLLLFPLRKAVLS